MGEEGAEGDRLHCQMPASDHSVYLAQQDRPLLRSGAAIVCLHDASTQGQITSGWTQKHLGLSFSLFFLKKKRIRAARFFLPSFFPSFLFFWFEWRV